MELTIGITGAIGCTNIEAYLIAIRTYFPDASVNIIATENSQKFIRIDNLKYYTPNVYTNSEDDKRRILHIEIAKKTDLLIIIPATANIIGKLSNGIADDLLSTTLVAYSNKNTLIFPSMNPMMWENVIVKQNVSRLRENGYQILNVKRRSYLVCENKFTEIECGLPTPLELIGYIKRSIKYEE